MYEFLIGIVLVFVYLLIGTTFMAITDKHNNINRDGDSDIGELFFIVCGWPVWIIVFLLIKIYELINPNPPDQQKASQSENE
jgi:amino acid permease